MSQILFGDDIRFKNGIVFPITVTNSSAYNITSTSGPNGGNDYAIVCTTTDTVVNLPSDQNGLEEGRTYQIIAATSDVTPNITINGGDHNINGESNIIINAARNTVTIMFTNATSEWHII